MYSMRLARQQAVFRFPAGNLKALSVQDQPHGGGHDDLLPTPQEVRALHLDRHHLPHDDASGEDNNH